MDVYIDVLFLVNFILNYIVLKISDRIQKAACKDIFLLIGSAIGGIYSILMILFPDINFLSSFLGKMLLSGIMVAIVFRPGGIKIFFKNMAVFYGISFLLGGSILALMYLGNQGGFVRNGVVYYYFHSSVMTVIFGIVFSSIIIYSIYNTVKINKVRKNTAAGMMIRHNGNSVSLNALIDTGHHVKDPISGKSAAIIEIDALRSMMPDEVYALLKETGTKDKLVTGDIWNEDTYTEIIKHFQIRVIPYHAIGNENDMMIGIIVDELQTFYEDKTYVKEKAMIGICNMPLSADHSYVAILSTDFVQE